MATGYGVSPDWVTNTVEGRNHMANKGLVRDGLVLLLDAGATDSYPGSGTTWYDLSGNGNNGTLTNGPTFDSGNGGSIDFDGSNDTVNFTYDLRSDWSFECWVNQDQLNAFTILGQGITSSRSGLHIWFTLDNRIRFGMYSNDTDFTVTTSTGVWYNYVFTYSHNSPYTKQFFRNGQSISGTPVQTQTQYIGTGDVRVGAIYSSGAQYGNGRFAMAKLYNRILTAAEIQKNYNATKGRYGL